MFVIKMKIPILILLSLVCFSCQNKTETPKNLPEQVDISTVNKEERMGLVSEGNKSPNAKIITINDSIIEIESFKGKLLIIDFWATWCAPCLQEAPLFTRLVEKYKNTNAEFISISVDEDITDWKNFISENTWKGKNYWFGMQEEKAFFSLLYSKHRMQNKEMVLIGLP